VPSGEATQQFFLICGLTRSGREPTIYRTRDEHVNHYTTDAVMKILLYEIIIYKPARYICENDCRNCCDEQNKAWRNFGKREITRTVLNML